MKTAMHQNKRIRKSHYFHKDCNKYQKVDLHEKIYPAYAQSRLQQNNAFY